MINLPPWMVPLVIVGLVISAINHVINIAKMFNKPKEPNEPKEQSDE